MNIIDYVINQGTESFYTRPLQTEDVAVLCLFSYFKVDGIMTEMDEHAVTLQDLATSPHYSKMFRTGRNGKMQRLLLEAMLESERFKDIKLFCYINRIEIENETQFAAFTVILPTGVAVITFRGTDETIVGWQEDMKLALKRPVMGQMLSAKYINDVSKRVHGHFIVAGHSKGGNLAMYSSMCAHKRARNRIDAVYSFDGPGFRPEFLEENNFEEIKNRTKKYIPRSSLIGMILSSGSECTVVDSTSVGVMQHELYSWKVSDDGHFVNAKLSKQHADNIKTLNEWILSLDEAHLEHFVSLLNRLLGASEAFTTTQFSKDILKHSAKMLRAYNDVDGETKKFVMLFIKSYFTLAGEVAVNELKTRLGI